MNSVVAALPDNELHVILDNLNTYKKNERLAQETPQRAFRFHSDKVVVAQSGRNLVFDPAASALNGASFTVVEQLQVHIDAVITADNETAEPFAWTKKKVYQRRFKNRRITQL